MKQDLQEQECLYKESSEQYRELLEQYNELKTELAVSHKEYENLKVYLFEPYEKLGGNGSAKRIMQEVDKLPIHKFIQNKEDEHDEHDET